MGKMKAYHGSDKYAEAFGPERAGEAHSSRTARKIPEEATGSALEENKKEAS